MICESCNQYHDGTYGSGRFCCTSCAKTFSARLNRNYRDEKKTGPRQHLPIEVRRSMTKRANEVQAMKRQELYERGHWNELPLSYKRRKVLEEQKGKCVICGIDSWMGKEITFHFDHIDGIKTNNSRENVRFLCPNCHSQTKTYCGKKQNIPEFNYLKTTKD